MWDLMPRDKAERREQELITGEQFWGGLLQHGCRAMRQDDGSVSATRIIRHVLTQKSPRSFQLQDEMANGVPLIETRVGRVLEEKIDAQARLFNDQIKELEVEIARLKAEKEERDRREGEERQRRAEEEARRLEDEAQKEKRRQEREAQLEKERKEQEAEREKERQEREAEKERERQEQEAQKEHERQEREAREAEERERRDAETKERIEKLEVEFASAKEQKERNEKEREELKKPWWHTYCAVM